MCIRDRLLGGCGTRAPHPVLRGQGFRNPATSIVYKPAKLRYNKRYNILTVSYTHLDVYKRQEGEGEA